MAGVDLQLPDDIARGELFTWQARRLGPVLQQVWQSNPWYRQRWAAAGVEGCPAVQSPEALRRLPSVSAADLRAARRSAAAGEPSVSVHRLGAWDLIYDTAGGWHWVLQGWNCVWRAAGAGNAGQRVFFGVDFEPQIWCWAGFESAQQHGMFTLTGSAMSPLQKAETIFGLRVDVLVTTLADGLSLGETARQHGFDPAHSPLRAVIYDGEPAAAAAISRMWGAQALAISLMAEVGLVGYQGSSACEGLHLMESQLICEVVDPGTGRAAAAGELVITALGRPAAPVIRYRTGRPVRIATAPCGCGRTFTLTAGGIAARPGQGEAKGGSIS